jgi:hypothetical protein
MRQMNHIFDVRTSFTQLGPLDRTILDQTIKEKQ